MLLDQELLDAIEMKLNKKRSLFNIQVLLQALQLVTRPLNYPPNYKDEINDDFYLRRIKQKLDEAKKLSNKQPTHAYLFKDVLPQLVFGCYCIDLIRFELKEDLGLLGMLEQVVDKRLYTSAEEQCAEKTLLRMLINMPQETKQLCSVYQDTLNYSSIQQDIMQRISFLNDIHQQDAPNNANIESTIKIFAEATTAASECLNDLGPKLREYLKGFSTVTINGSQTSQLINKCSYFGHSIPTSRPASSDSVVMQTKRPESSDSVLIEEYFSDEHSSDELQPLNCLSSR